MLESINSRKPAVFLLHGVTGSGKTSVFEKLINDTVKLGRQAMLLIPEIGLTPQILKRFRSLFGERVAVIHSGLSQGQRLDEYKRIQYERILQYKYNDYDTSNWSTLYLEYKIFKNKKDELMYKLTESKTQRNISKTVNYIGSITPQHVSGRVYKVENGDGCATFCIWFLIIDALLIFLYYIISGG